MQVDIHIKLQAMLWDIPEEKRSDLAHIILSNPGYAFLNDEQLLIRALSSLGWYELTKLIDKQTLLTLLTDSTIQKLFPVQRRSYYTNARRLLSKYTVSVSGQGS